MLQPDTLPLGLGVGKKVKEKKKREDRWAREIEVCLSGHPPDRSECEE